MNQLIIPYQKNIKKNFENFFSNSNKNNLIIKNIKEIFSGKHCQIYLEGEKYFGKSHILHSACNFFDDKKCIYIPLKEENSFKPDILDGFENYDLICIDDINYIFGKDDWEFKIFVLINKVLENSKKIIFSSTIKPEKDIVNLQDLQSRLSWSLLLNIEEPTDKIKIEILKKTILEYEYNIVPESCNYLMKNRDRSIKSLLDDIHKIGSYSLSTNKKITLKNLRSVLS